MRWGVVATLVALSTVGLSQANDAKATISQFVNIPAQPLGTALAELARTRDLQIIYHSEIVGARRTAGAVGEFTPEQELKQLLHGTGLTYRYLNNTTVTIVPTASISNAAGKSAATDNGREKEGKTASSARFRLARVARDQIQESASVGASKRAWPAASPTLEEVVVTAEKRAETLADAPVPVTAISGTTLAEEHELRLQDYYSSVPGLSLAASNRGDQSILAIRGITTGGGNPTIGIVVDGVPYGSSSAYAGGGPPPDLDPSDLARIEVLRGPQGTLYGADSLGGLIKFVTIEPSTRELTGQVRVGADGVQNGTKAGYDVHAAVNVPLREDLGLRASGFARRDPGYIDNIEYNIHGVNQFDVDGGLLSVLWEPTSRFSLNVGALLQDGKTDGSSNVESGLGDLKEDDLLGSGASEQHVHVYHATMDAQIRGVKLTSITGYSDNSVFHIVDFTPVFGPLTQEVFGVTGTPLLEEIRTERATQELRLTGSLTSSFDWLLGGYYDHEASKTQHHLLAVGAAGGALGPSTGTWLSVVFPTTFRESAAFVDLTYHLTKTFDVQLGGRYSKNRQTYSEVDGGPYVTLLLGVPAPLVNPEITTNDSSFTYLVTPRLKVSRHLMIYARLATGFRPGGPNPTSTAFGLPTHFNPDKTQNYEIGAKGDVLDHLLSFDGSIYYINWKDIQLSLVEPTSHAQYFANGSAAKSQGVEFSGQVRPFAGLTAGIWFTLNDAELTKGFPATSAVLGMAGDKLPYTSRTSGGLSLDEEFPLPRGLSGFVGGSWSYVGDRKGIFVSKPHRQDLPGYGRMDLRAGVRGEDWTVDLYGNNLTDKRGVLSGGIGTSYNPMAFTYIAPRTVGVDVSKTF